MSKRSERDEMIRGYWNQMITSKPATPYDGYKAGFEVGSVYAEAELARVREENQRLREACGEAFDHIVERSNPHKGYDSPITRKLSAILSTPQSPRPSITEPADRVASVIREQSTSRPLRDIIAEKIQP